MPHDRPSILLVTSNGTGMGHLTRQSAIALAMDGRADVALLSLSSGVGVVIDQGFRAEYVPSYHLPLMPRWTWNAYLRDRIVLLAQELGVDVIAFDGVAPYRGLLQARLRLPEVGFVWFRRGLWKAGRNLAALRTEKFFDLIITPGDYASPADQGPTSQRPSLNIEPISLLDEVRPLPRNEAAQEIGLDPSHRTALLTIGSGALGESSQIVEQSADYLRRLGWQVATTRAALKRSETDVAGVVVLQDVYPLARYVRAFDLIVSAAGYNAVHEFITAGIPTVLIPNRDTSTDDQVTRARYAATAGIAEWVDPDEGITALEPALSRAINNSVQLADEASRVAARHSGGANQAATILIDLAASYRGDQPRPTTRMSRLAMLARGEVTSSVMRAAGPRAANAVRAATRRKPDNSPPHKVHISLDVDQSLEAKLPASVHLTTRAEVGSRASRTVHLSESVPLSALRTGVCVEHVLPETSAGYLANRIALIERSYIVDSIRLGRTDQ